MTANSDQEQALAELHLVDRRHGEERPFLLRLTPTHLILTELDENGDPKTPPPQGFSARLMSNIRQRFGETGPLKPHALDDTDVRIDDNGIRIRMGSNAVYSYADYDRWQSGQFIMAYLRAKKASSGQ